MTAHIMDQKSNLISPTGEVVKEPSVKQIRSGSFMMRVGDHSNNAYGHSYWNKSMSQSTFKNQYLNQQKSQSSLASDITTR